MKERDIQYLRLLKKRIVETMKLSHPGIGNSISEWKGQEITNFQEDLLNRVNGYISEKWFYTHMKSESWKLPRIDMLNLLARYVGYNDWNDFKFKNKENLPFAVQKIETSGSIPYLKIFGLIILLIVSLLLIKSLGNKNYQFRLVDAYTKKRISDTLTEIIIINENESPLHMKCNPPGYFDLKTKKEKVRFLVRVPYYKTDTITRILDKYENFENIYLYPNDFALMIHYFSATNVKDWEKRRDQLDRMIADSAYIYQVFKQGQLGMELYNKQEFIDKLTMPVSSLENIEVIETIYTAKKISLLRFRQEND